MKYPFNKNTIYIGDCRDVLKEFPDESADLIYLDPPFFSNKDYEIVFDDGAEKRGFEDRWKGGIYQYINWMKERVEPMYDILKDTGNFYLHCDWHASHYLRMMLDDIFGSDNFQNEIIWHYRKMANIDTRFARNHDILLRYGKGDNKHFSLYDKEKTRALYNRFKKIIKDDKLKWEQAKKREQQLLNHYVEQKRKELDRELRDDDVILDFTNPEDKYKERDDVWSIPHLKGNSEEHIGYPTQKPKELLERVIKCSTEEGDLVLDPFCGCGTTITAAEKLNRNWIGIDISPKAAEVMKKRMWDEYGIDSDVIGLPQELEEQKSWIKSQPPIDFQNYIVRCYNGRQQRKKRSDKGIDGWTENRNPIQVKRSENVGRPVVDKFESAIKRDNKKRGIIVGLSFSKGAYEEVARVENEDELEIELVTLDELVDRKIKEGELPAVIRPLKNLVDGDGRQKTLGDEK